MPEPLWRLLLLNGPNLNLLGRRETSIYGPVTLETIQESCRQAAHSLGASLECYQSNYEGALVERIQQAMEGVDLILINPAAYTHTSVAIRDALLAVALPVIEIHLSNIHKREPFRHHSYVSDVAIGVIAGFGPSGYLAAIDLAIQYLNRIAKRF